jgi:hypothetical protein
VKELQDNDVECSKMGEQMLTMKNKMVGHLQRVIILFSAVSKKSVKDGVSQFQNFRVNFHKFHALISTRLSQLGYAITNFAQVGL